MERKTRWICLNALGIALFVTLAMCLRVPVFENYYLCLGYVVMVVWAGLFGGVSAAMTGVLGVVVYCMITGGMRGLPGWAAGNLLIGLGLGWGMRALFKAEGSSGRSFFGWLAMCIWIVLITAAGILGVKSLVECMLYAQPLAVRIAKNSYAFVADVVVIWCGLAVYRLVRAAWRSIENVPGT